MNNILFCGDVMPGGVLPYQQEYISGDLLDYLKSFDLRVGTLEAAIGTNLEYDTTKVNGRQNIIYARDEDFYRVVEMGFDVVSLANNHVFDLGEEGLKNTIKHLNENGIKYCGAGMNIEEASKPAVVEYKGKKIAFLAYCMYGNKYLGYVELADKNKPGINPLNMDQVIADIKKYKQIYDLVIVMPHWGREYSYFPMPECKKMAYQMIDAGADAVMASHAHNIQPMIRYKNRWIYFCMGNFLFPDYYMHPPRPIWYPENQDECSRAKRILGYPPSIDHYAISVWNGRSRIGIVAKLNIDNSNISANYDLVGLSENNIVEFYDGPNSKIKRIRMYLMGKIIKLPNYTFCLRCYESKWNIPRRAVHFISRKLHINYDIKVNI